MKQVFNYELNRYGECDTNNDTAKENRFTAEVIHNNAPFD